MSTKNFFEKPNEWSLVKNDLLKYYLHLYFTKIFQTRIPINYIDCFAGAGLFDNGEYGSPNIALSEIKTTKEISKNNPDVYCYFIENTFYKELENNIIKNVCNTKVYNTDYKTSIFSILETCKDENVFIYIDPFGPTDLHYDSIAKICENSYNSIELLINFSPNGFLREGCRLIKIPLEDIHDDNIEIDYSINSRIPNSILNMNRVANGDYWQDILHEYYKDKQNNIKSNLFLEAENKFMKEYCNQLRKIFKYVINIPIKIKTGNISKYHMVFTTNNHHGYIEMAHNMYKRWENICEKERGGQISLFDYEKINIDGGFLSENIRVNLLKYITKSPRPYYEILCEYIKNNGIFFNLSKINTEMKIMENENIVQITRFPSITRTGKKAAWIDYRRRMEVNLK